MVAGDEKELTALVLLGFLCLVIYRVVLWVMGARRTADPWGAEVDEALNADDTRPLCHHCLTPQEHNGWFCPECGAVVGPYANYMPYVNIFSQGEVLRAGVSERLRRTPLTLIGYVLLSFAFFIDLVPLFLIWAPPLYLIFFVAHLRRQNPDNSVPPPIP